eukprot:1130570-Amphidinium_carterae.1
MSFWCEPRARTKWGRCHVKQNCEADPISTPRIVLKTSPMKDVDAHKLASTKLQASLQHE